MIVKELINSVEALNVLTTTKLPAKTSYKLAVFLKEIADDIDLFNKTRDEKLKIFGEPILSEEGKETGKYSFSKDNGQKFIDEIKELEEVEVTKAIPVIKLEDLGNIEIEPKYLATLSWLIKE